MTTKTILAGTLTAAPLALGGGAAYAATTGGGPSTHAPAVTTVQHAQPAATQPVGQHPAAGTATPGPGNSHAYRCDHPNGYGHQASRTYTWRNGSWCCRH